MWKLDHKEGRESKNWCFQTVVLEKILLSPLDSKEIKPVNTKGNQPWIFVGRTDAKAEAPILWPPDANSLMKRPWYWERLKAEGEEGDRGWDGWIALDSMDMNLGKLREMVREKEAWHAIACGITVRHNLATEHKNTAYTKDFTLTVLKTFKEENKILKELKEPWKELKQIRTIYENIENVYKEIQIKILELKSTLTDIKISIENFNSRYDQAEERISELRGKIK